MGLELGLWEKVEEHDTHARTNEQGVGSTKFTHFHMAHLT
jgi:hypothetical protein